jgi:hypothetical protein
MKKWTLRHLLLKQYVPLFSLLAPTYLLYTTSSPNCLMIFFKTFHIFNNELSEDYSRNVSAAAAATACVTQTQLQLPPPPVLRAAEATGAPPSAWTPRTPLLLLLLLSAALGGC